MLILKVLVNHIAKYEAACLMRDKMCGNIVFGFSLGKKE